MQLKSNTGLKRSKVSTGLRVLVSGHTKRIQLQVAIVPVAENAKYKLSEATETLLLLWLDSANAFIAKTELYCKYIDLQSR